MGAGFELKCLPVDLDGETEDLHEAVAAADSHLTTTVVVAAEVVGVAAEDPGDLAAVAHLLPQEGEAEAGVKPWQNFSRKADLYRRSTNVCLALYCFNL